MKRETRLMVCSCQSRFGDPNDDRRQVWEVTCGDDPEPVRCLGILPRDQALAFVDSHAGTPASKVPRISKA